MTLSEFLRSTFTEPQYLLIGNPVSQSVSPLIHNASLKELQLPGHYSAVQMLPDEIDQFPELLANPFVQGLNITLPYKQTLVQFADELDSEATLSGVINTLYRSEEKWMGGNSDILGIETALKPFEEIISSNKAVIFGSGGASRAAVIALRRLGVSAIGVVARRPDALKTSFDSFPEVELLEYSQWQSATEQAALFINSTPLGMWPNIGASPIQASEFELLREKVVFDMVYKPLNTLFLLRAKSVQAHTVDGLTMLLHQANAAFQKWTGYSFPVESRREELIRSVDPALELITIEFNSSEFNSNKGSSFADSEHFQSKMDSPKIHSALVNALFTLRNASFGTYEDVKGLDFGWKTRTAVDFKEASWKILEDQVNWTSNRAWLEQVHGAEVIPVDSPGFAGQGDALVTKTKGVALTIQVADCIPLLFADTRNGVIGAAHAGWRGVASAVAPQTIEAMTQLGAERRHIQAWIGPGISLEHFEVGEEVASQFPEQAIDRSFEKPHVNLELVLRSQLIDSGIPASQITAQEGCTFHDSEIFHSFRRDRDSSGRMVAMIVLNS